jgi:hypothetical protein
MFAFATALTVLLATPDDGFWINDCGNKALVAKRLLETGFRNPHFDHPAVAVDPSARAFPIAAPFAVERPAGSLSVYPLAYPALSAPFLAVFGPIGLRLPAAFGLAACTAAMVLWLAPAFGRRWALVGGLVLAFATPLFFYGVTLWEHSLTVALCIGAWGLLDRDSSARLFTAGWLLASACWLREEIALMGVAVAIAAWLQWRRPGVLLWLVAGAALPALALLALNAGLYGSPLDALVRHNGLLIQMPMFALVGFGAASLGERVCASLRVGLLAGSLFLLFALIAGVGFGSGYGVQSGFGVHWGPRVLLPALPAVVALAVAAIRAGLGSSVGAVVRVSRAAALALLLAGLLSSALATAILAEQKRDAARFQQAVRNRPERFMLSTHPLLAQHLAGLWDEKPQLLATDSASLTAAVVGLRAGGAAPFLLVVPDGAPAASLAGASCATVDRYRGEWLHYFDLDIQGCRFKSQASRRRG